MRSLLKILVKTLYSLFYYAWILRKVVLQSGRTASLVGSLYAKKKTQEDTNLRQQDTENKATIEKHWR